MIKPTLLTILLLLSNSSLHAQSPPPLALPSGAEAILQDGAQGTPPVPPSPTPSTNNDDASGNGTNPADTARRLVLRNEYLELGNGTIVNTTVARLAFPAFGKRGSLSLELPFNFYDITVDGVQGSAGGLGDVKFGASYNLWTSESKQITIITGSDFWIPSADNVLLDRKINSGRITFQDIGTGKFRMGPLAGFVYAFSPTTIFAPIYQHEFSFAGKRERASIHRGVVRLFFMNAWKSGIYVLPEVQLLIDYTGGTDKTLDAFLMPEVGYSKKGTTLFVKPGFGINAGPENRYFSVNFGLRQDF